MKQLSGSGERLARCASATLASQLRKPYRGAGGPVLYWVAGSPEPAAFGSRLSNAAGLLGELAPRDRYSLRHKGAVP